MKLLLDEIINTQAIPKGWHYYRMKLLLDEIID
jgi:hypothetical protein